MRQEMVYRVNHIPFEFGEFFSFRVGLSQALEDKVLKLNRFSELQLVVTQYAEMQMIHQTQMAQKEAQITSLTNQINQINLFLNRPNEQNSHPPQNLEKAIPEDIAYLKLMNENLTQSVTELLAFKTKYENLFQDYQTVKAERDALLAEKEKTSANNNQNKKSTPNVLPSFN